MAAWPRGRVLLSIDYILYFQFFEQGSIKIIYIKNIVIRQLSHSVDRWAGHMVVQIPIGKVEISE